MKNTIIKHLIVHFSNLRRIITVAFVGRGRVVEIFSNRLNFGGECNAHNLLYFTRNRNDPEIGPLIDERVNTQLRR